MTQLSGFNSPTIATGSTTSCAVNAVGEVIVWGTQPSGQPALSDAVSVETNEFCVMALRSTGTVEVWGSNNYGQLDVPAGLSGVVQISMGAYHCLALKSDGTVVAWGSNNGGQAAVPAGLAGVIQVAAGGNTSFALKSDGTLQGWGSNGNFQLNVPPGIGVVNQISVGNSLCLALIDDGTVEAWGSTTSGQLDVPPAVSSPNSISAGRNYGMALQDGAVIMWGDDSNGLDTPPAAAGSSVVAIAANSQGGATAMCVRDDGTVVMWGRNLVGETDVPTSLTAMTPGVPPAEGQIVATVPFTVNLSGEQVQNPGGITATVDFTGSFTGFDNWLKRIDPIQLQEVYTFRLTGSADGLPDLDMEISSWQATNQAGTRQSYLMAVIPNALDIIGDIEARQSGELVLCKGYRFSDGSVRSEEILRSNFDNFRFDRGRQSFTVTVSGYLGGRQSQNAHRTLTGIRAINLTNGKYRVRAAIDMFLQPGMTVTAEGVTFRADYINYYVSQADKFCEVSER